MNHQRFKVSILFLSLLVGVQLGWGEYASTAGVRYKLVPNLEETKDHDPAPDFTLPVLRSEGAGSEEALPVRLVAWLRRLLGRTTNAGTPPPEQISLRDYRGRLVLLNFWASWCEPCREEMPAMERLFQEFRHRGLTILAVNIKDNRKDAARFVESLGLTFPVAFDPNGDVGLLYGAWGLPTTYLIARDGITLARAWGPADWYGPGARKLIATLLEAKDGGR